MTKRTDKTVAAWVASIALVAVAGTLAAAAVFQPPSLGLGHPSEAASATLDKSPVPAGAASGTTPPAPAPDPGAPGTVDAPSHADTTLAPSRPSGEDTGVPAAAPTIPPPALAPPTTTEAAPQHPAPSSPPSGCREPEWDSEHQVWQCDNEERD